MKTIKTIKLLSLGLLATLVFSACSDDDDAPQVINEEEVITTLNLKLTPEGGGETIDFIYRDLDADGSNPEIISPALSANTTYTGRVQFLNELENPAEDITIEVLEEAEEHQVFYIVEDSLDATPTYTGALDNDGNPIGVEFSLQTGEASQGNFTVILIHEGDKNVPGASEGDLSPEVGGETDIEVTFDVTVE
jgi:hypothetical protein